MSRTPATIKQADVARTIRAAKAAGVACVDIITKDGTTLRMHLDGKPGETTTIAPEVSAFDQWKAGQNARKA